MLNLDPVPSHGIELGKRRDEPEKVEKPKKDVPKKSAGVMIKNKSGQKRFLNFPFGRTIKTFEREVVEITEEEFNSSYFQERKYHYSIIVGG